MDGDIKGIKRVHESGRTLDQLHEKFKLNFSLRCANTLRTNDAKTQAFLLVNDFSNQYGARTLNGSYIVLARKWRPAQFSDLVGQAPVIRTLMNAIQSSRVHHAYLLTGSRGIGKTSIARIFAKSLRCENSQWVKDAQGHAWLKSCDECSSCKEIASGQSVDVIEIDGASNNGVDAVREIRENAKYLPSTGSRKIYIIDEVHMLTTAAFNALLKTLEEPPPHVIFILATTEPHKIPGTILSRCQRFDLKKVTSAQIQSRLSEVAGAEKISIESGALALLARAAEGSMRDALSLFDQVIAFSGNQITAQSVRDSIGLVEGQLILGILNGIFSRSPIEALKLVESAYLAGHDLKLLTRNLIEFLHGAILSKVGVEDSGHLELSTEEWAELQRIARLRELEEIELFFQVFQHGIEWIARSPQPRIVLEVLIVKCASAESLLRVSGTSGGTPKAPTPSAPAPSKATSDIVHRAHTLADHIAHPPQEKTIVFGSGSNATLAKKANESAQTVQAYSGPKTWESFIEYTKKTRPLLASVLEHASCESFPLNPEDPFTICFKLEDAYYKEQLGSKTYLELIQTMTREFFGIPKRLGIEVRENVTSVAETREKARAAQEKAAQEAVQKHPVIAEARSLFGGELGPIELISTSTDGGATP
jgi:DNA polymerase-3 subunit gamma/tau